MERALFATNRATHRTMKCFIPAGLVAIAMFIGCSDEREPIPPPATDGAVKDAGASADADAVADISSTDGPGPDGYIDLFDVIPLPDGGCPGCIRDRCGAGINACFNNPACTAGLLCTLQMCAGGLLGDAGLNPTSFVCILGCFNGDQNLALMALSSFTCLTMTCGAACNFIDAGSDARPPDVLTPPDVSSDATGADAAEDAPAADGQGPAIDSGSSDGDGATPGDDAAGGDVAPETGGPPDTMPPADALVDATPPDDGTGD